MSDATELTGRVPRGWRSRPADDVQPVRHVEVPSRVLARREVILGILTQAYDRDLGRNSGTHELG